MTRKNLQSIMNLAWRFVKLNGMTLSNALKLSWRNAKLYRRLCGSKVSFEFRKVDGTIRSTTGTISTHIIPSQSLPNGLNGHKKNANMQAYYDIDKQAWRSFKRENLISIIK